MRVRLDDVVSIAARVSVLVDVLESLVVAPDLERAVGIHYLCDDLFFAQLILLRCFRISSHYK